MERLTENGEKKEKGYVRKSGQKVHLFSPSENRRRRKRKGLSSGRRRDPSLSCSVWGRHPWQYLTLILVIIIIIIIAIIIIIIIAIIIINIIIIIIVISFCVSPVAMSCTNSPFISFSSPSSSASSSSSSPSLVSTFQSLISFRP